MSIGDELIDQLDRPTLCAVCGDSIVPIEDEAHWSAEWAGWVHDHHDQEDHQMTDLGCAHSPDEDHDETCVCSDHPEWTLTEGCRECDPDHYDENGSIL